MQEADLLEAATADPLVQDEVEAEAFLLAQHEPLFALSWARAGVRAAAPRTRVNARRVFFIEGISFLGGIFG